MAKAIFRVFVKIGEGRKEEDREGKQWGGKGR